MAGKPQKQNGNKLVFAWALVHTQDVLLYVCRSEYYNTEQCVKCFLSYPIQFPSCIPHPLTLYVLESKSMFSKLAYSRQGIRALLCSKTGMTIITWVTPNKRDVGRGYAYHYCCMPSSPVLLHIYCTCFSTIWQTVIPTSIVCDGRGVHLSTKFMLVSNAVVELLHSTTMHH